MTIVCMLKEGLGDLKQFTAERPESGSLKGWMRSGRHGAGALAMVAKPADRSAGYGCSVKCGPVIETTMDGTPNDAG
jgi:hypothetical protein